jgi:tetratricopeptide (TPR) repeat protein
LAALSSCVLSLTPAPAGAAETPAQQQLDFGADMARRGLWKEALFRFQQADQLDPGNPRILNNIAVSYEALGLFDEALEAYQKALKVGPEDRELRGNYSRFAEFYQSFRPTEPGGEATAESPQAGEVASVAEPPSEPEPEETPTDGDGSLDGDEPQEGSQDGR